MRIVKKKILKVKECLGNVYLLQTQSTPFPVLSYMEKAIKSI